MSLLGEGLVRGPGTLGMFPSFTKQLVKIHCVRNSVAMVKQDDQDAAEVLVLHGEGQEMLSQAGSPRSCLSVTGV